MLVCGGKVAVWNAARTSCPQSQLSGYLHISQHIYSAVHSGISNWSHMADRNYRELIPTWAVYMYTEVYIYIYIYIYIIKTFLKGLLLFALY
jgi:hypothetical protein